MKQLLFFLICGTLISSCTITKRHFGNGYHVEWNRKMKSAPGREESPNTEVIETNVALKNISEPDSLPGNEVGRIDQSLTNLPAAEPKETTADMAMKQQELQSGTEIRTDREIKVPEAKPRHDPEEEVNKPRVHPLTYVIWGFWGVSLAFCMVLIAGNMYAILVIAGCMLIAMILGIIMIKNLRKNPEKYRLKAGSYIFAIFSIVIGGIATLVGLLVLAAWDSF